MRVAIVTSSISCLPAEQVQKYGIKVVPMPFMLNGHSYLDGVDISATEVYEQLAYERPFRTSAPSPGDYLKVYREALSEYDAILCLTVPSKISMMYDSACSAAEQIPKDTIVDVLDTGTAAGGQALIDIAAAEASTAGATLEEVKQLIANLKGKVRLYGLIVDPKYLARTGRVPAPLPSAASALSIKPVFTIAQGRIKLVSVVRTEKAGVDRMLSMMHADVGRKPVRVIIQHANVPRQAENLRQRVQADFNCAELRVTEFSPIIGFATGPGCLATAFRAEN
ncbi:MAG: DegV family protein [Dehalococcoidia bacterium]|nr:DegV family protein [Dehalococcoidia bacterium]